MPEWKDATSYSQEEEERVPRAWSTRLGKLRVVVTKHIRYPGHWVMHCDPFYDTYPLDVETAEDAKDKALELVEAEIDKVLIDLFNQ